MISSPNLILISGSSHPALANEIASFVQQSLSKTDIFRFSDQELNIKILDNVRGKDVFIIQSTCYPVNEHIMELVLLLDALKRASAKRINVVMPYFGYGRQDRKVEPRVPISAKAVARIIETSGADRILSMDLHANQIQGFFDIPVDHLFAGPTIVEYFQKLNLDNYVVVSPDSGGVERARFIAKRLDCSLAIIDKRREKVNEAQVIHVIGDIQGKNCIIIDDMIDTAGTICKAAEALKVKGALSIFAGTTHGVLSGNAIERLKNSLFEKVVFTNTIPIPKKKQLDIFQYLSVASIIGKAILNIHSEKSVSSLFK